MMFNHHRIHEDDNVAARIGELIVFNVSLEEVPNLIQHCVTAKDTRPQQKMLKCARIYKSGLVWLILISPRSLPVDSGRRQGRVTLTCCKRRLLVISSSYSNQHVLIRLLTFAYFTLLDIWSAPYALCCVDAP